MHDRQLDSTEYMADDQHICNNFTYVDNLLVCTICGNIVSECSNGVMALNELIKIGEEYGEYDIS